MDIGCVARRVAESVAGKALRQLRQDLQVLLRRVLRHAHREYQVDRRMVAGTEIDRVFEPQERAAGGGKRIAACVRAGRSEEHTSELQSLMRSSYAVFCLKKTTNNLYQQSNYRTK